MLKSLHPVHPGWYTPDPRPVHALLRPASPSVASKDPGSLDAHMARATKLPGARFGKRYTGKQMPEMFIAPGGVLFELSKTVSAGAEATFKMARCTNRYGETSIVGVKTPLTAPRRTFKPAAPEDGPLVGELQAMLAAHSSLDGDLYTTDTDEVFLVMRLADNHLENAIAHVHGAGTSPGMTEAWAVDVLHQICKRLVVMHGRNYAHRDLKTENIFVTIDGEVLVGDYGKASNKDRLETASTGGSQGFLSPAMLRGETAVIEDDMWMLGVIAANLIMKGETSPFHPDRDFGGLDNEAYNAHWLEISRVEMDGYLRWRQGDKADTLGNKKPLRLIPDYNAHVDYMTRYNAWYFGKLDDRAPALAPIIKALLDPDIKERPAIDAVYEALAGLQQEPVGKDVKAVWAHVKRDPGIEAQRKEFEAATPRVPVLEALALELSR